MRFVRSLAVSCTVVSVIAVGTPAGASEVTTIPYIGHNDVAVGCPVDAATGIGLGGACFNVAGATTVHVKIVDASGLKVGGFVQYLDAHDKFYERGFCGEGEFPVLPGASTLVVFVDGPGNGFLDCAVAGGVLPYGVGTAGEITVTR